jgi:hypothetical protein
MECYNRFDGNNESLGVDLDPLTPNINVLEALLVCIPVELILANTPIYLETF